MARSVRVSVGFTQNLQNFESLRTGIEYEDELDPKPTLEEEALVGPGETHDEVADRLFESLEAKLIEKAKANYETMTEEARRATQIRPKQRK